MLSSGPEHGSTALLVRHGAHLGTPGPRACPATTVCLTYTLLRPCLTPCVLPPRRTLSAPGPAGWADGCAPLPALPRRPVSVADASLASLGSRCGCWVNAAGWTGAFCLGAANPAVKRPATHTPPALVFRLAGARRRRCGSLPVTAARSVGKSGGQPGEGKNRGVLLFGGLGITRGLQRAP